MHTPPPPPSPPPPQSAPPAASGHPGAASTSALPHSPCASDLGTTAPSYHCRAHAAPPPSAARASWGWRPRLPWLLLQLPPNGMWTC
eukprot:1157282-Pelagomonas_calceolata.AAC.6